MAASRNGGGQLVNRKKTHEANMGQSKFRQMQTYLFFKHGGWYPVEWVAGVEEGMQHRGNNNTPLYPA
jgi:hypothetical protein